MAKETRTVHVKVTSNVSSIGRETSKATKQAGGLKGALKGVAASASLATGGIRAMTMALLSSGVGAIVVALGGLVSILTATIRESAEFSESMSGLKAILDADKDTMEAFSREAKRLGATTAFTASQVVELQTEFAKLGFTNDEILNVTESTLNLAAAAGTDLANAAMVAGSTLRAFGLSSDETARITDVMAKSFSSSALDITHFQESMKMVAPIAKTVKVDVELASAALSVLADNGIKGSMAGTQLRKTMIELATKTGKDFSTSMDIVKERMAGATTTADKLAIATEMVGLRSAASLVILADNTDKIKDLEKAYDRATGSAEKMAKTKLDNLTGDIKILKSAWSGLLLSFDDGQGMLTKMVRQPLKLFTEALNDLTDVSQFLGFTWEYVFSGLGDTITSNFIIAIGQFKLMNNKIREFALKAKLEMADVPILGKALDADEVQKNLDEVQARMKAVAQVITKTRDKEDKKRAEKGDFWTTWEEKKKRIELKETAALEASLEDTFVSGAGDGEDKEITEALEKRKKFLNALTKAEEDLSDKTDNEKIERRKQRHLAELEEIKTTETEKQELRKRIEEHYENLKDAKEKEKADKDKEKREKEAEKIKEELEKENLTKLEEIDAEEQERLAAIAGLENFEHLKTKIEKNAADKRNEIAKAEADMKRDILMSSASSIFGSLAAVSKKNAKASAAFSVAQIMMNTYTGMSEIEKKFASPELASDRALKMIAKASVLAQGIAGVANIKKTASSVGVSAGGGSAPSVTTQAPSFNVVGQQSADGMAIGSRLDALAGGALKAYVVESEVTNAQQLNNQVENTASLG